MVSVFLVVAIAQPGIARKGKPDDGRLDDVGNANVPHNMDTYQKFLGLSDFAGLTVIRET